MSLFLVGWRGFDSRSYAEKFVQQYRHIKKVYREVNPSWGQEDLKNRFPEEEGELSDPGEEAEHRGGPALLLLPLGFRQVGRQGRPVGRTTNVD